MNNTQLKPPVKYEYKDIANDYKIIEINLSDSTENLYSVVTPINKI